MRDGSARKLLSCLAFKFFQRAERPGYLYFLDGSPHSSRCLFMAIVLRPSPS
jgi:hypothetical protein